MDYFYWLSQLYLQISHICLELVIWFSVERELWRMCIAA